ncbi:MAG: type II toxin-antitoxin system HicA family toxin [Acidobacteria bacterium]|nr:type II toxin-antitoxin system HicA family toxin [Acidobacteriota bacterium]
MMATLPVISGEAALRAFERAGWSRARQKGSHVSMVKHGVNANLSIPLHRELDRGTLRKLIRLAGLSVEEFVALLG